MNKFEALVDMVKSNELKLNDLLGKKQEEEKKCNAVIWVLAIVGIIVAVAGIAYVVYRCVKPDYLEDFEEDFEDEDDDDFEDDDEVFEDELPEA